MTSTVSISPERGEGSPSTPRGQRDSSFGSSPGSRPHGIRALPGLAAEAAQPPVSQARMRGLQGLVLSTDPPKAATTVLTTHTKVTMLSTDPPPAAGAILATRAEPPDSGLLVEPIHAIPATPRDARVMLSTDPPPTVGGTARKCANATRGVGALAEAAPGDVAALVDVANYAADRTQDAVADAAMTGAAARSGGGEGSVYCPGQLLRESAATLSGSSPSALSSLSHAAPRLGPRLPRLLGSGGGAQIAIPESSQSGVATYRKVVAASGGTCGGRDTCVLATRPLCCGSR